jgi:Mn2+/Fe2+ NRAMP family transporter
MIFVRDSGRGAVGKPLHLIPPNGITTYSIAGAQFGLTFLSTAFFTWPFMAAVQMMCART